MIGEFSVLLISITHESRTMSALEKLKKHDERNAEFWEDILGEYNV